MNDQHEAASGKADNVNDASSNPLKHRDDGGEQAYPNKANNSGGAGSPYGGTQSADPAAPDGNQQSAKQSVNKKGKLSDLPEGLGDEYDSKSSYGDKGDNSEGDKQGDSDARGAHIR